MSQIAKDVKQGGVETETGTGLRLKGRETYLSHAMAATATVRELRNHFPKVRKLVEIEGEVVV